MPQIEKTITRVVPSNSLHCVGPLRGMNLMEKLGPLLEKSQYTKEGLELFIPEKFAHHVEKVLTEHGAYMVHPASKVPQPPHAGILFDKVVS